MPRMLHSIILLRHFTAQKAKTANVSPFTITSSNPKPSRKHRTGRSKPSCSGSPTASKPYKQKISPSMASTSTSNRCSHKAAAPATHVREKQISDGPPSSSISPSPECTATPQKHRKHYSTTYCSTSSKNTRTTSTCKNK